MRRIGLLASLLLVWAAGCGRHEADHAHTGTTTETTAAAPQKKADDRQPRIEFPSGSGNASGYLALPAPPSTGRKPAIIVIQEWWGLNDWVEQQANRFAGQGYVALAVDLYRGKVAADPEEAHELMRGLPEDRAIADLKAGFDYLTKRPDVDPERIGVVGWCMGGGYALAFATAEPRLKATVINYGRLVTDFDTIAKLNAPILGNFGDEDRGIPVEDVKKFGQTLTKAGKLGDIKIYEGEGHGFMSKESAATSDAWNRIDGFFKRNLRGNIPNP